MHHPSPPPRAARKRGFTLVELSIVLVIIGLIVGGIMVGQDMVRASQLNRVLIDKDRLVSAISNFRTRYNAWPGDMTNATQIWGTASGGCPNGTRSGTQTCNGNGSGLIGDAWNGNDPRMVEMFLAMQHMANAGLISGQYNGYPTSGCTYCSAQIGTNSPITSIYGGTFMILGLNVGHVNFFNAVPKNAIMFGATNGNSEVANFPILRTTEAMTLDQKVDDGTPGNGNVRGLVTGAYGATCTTTTSAATALYNTSSSGPQCALLFN